MSRKMVLKKYGSIFIVCILLVGLLSGCGMREKDAKAYVTATLDASYKGKFKEYKKHAENMKYIHHLISMLKKIINSMI